MIDSHIDDSDLKATPSAEEGCSLDRLTCATDGKTVHSTAFLCVVGERTACSAAF